MIWSNILKLNSTNPYQTKLWIFFNVFFHWIFFSIRKVNLKNLTAWISCHFILATNNLRCIHQWKRTRAHVLWDFNPWTTSAQVLKLNVRISIISVSEILLIQQHFVLISRLSCFHTVFLIGKKVNSQSYVSHHWIFLSLLFLKIISTCSFPIIWASRFDLLELNWNTQVIWFAERWMANYANSAQKSKLRLLLYFIHALHSR